MTAANQTVPFELGTVAYSAVDNNWIATISNLPLYNKEGNVFYVYRYKVEEIEIDGKPVAESQYEVTTTVSKDGKTTTISNKVKEDAPELPSAGGIGTTIFYIFGSLLVLSSAVVLIACRRMKISR